jgi:putative aldouronate transport system permease protein
MKSRSVKRSMDEVVARSIVSSNATEPKARAGRRSKYSRDTIIFDSLITLLLIGVLIAVLVPLWYVIVVSLTPLSANQIQGYNLFLPPNQWSLEAYVQLLSQDTFISALLNSCIITGFGVATNMILTTLTAYGLTIKGLPGRNIFLSLILFTFLFNAGLIPTYLLVKDLNLLNTFAAVILPGAISVYNLFVMKTFFQSLPTTLREAAIVDGANELQVLWHVVLPLSKPIMLTIGMFYAVGQWNEFFLPILYLNDTSLMPLPVLLRNILSGASMSDYVGQNALSSTPQDALKMAAVILTMLPMLALYPWIQRHFTKGILLGSVKE